MALVVLCALIAPVHAAIPLVNDTFNTNDASAYVRWRADTDGSQATVTATDNALVVTIPSNSDGRGDNLIGRVFPKTALAVGDVLTLSYDVTSSSDSTAIINFQRVGIYDLGAAFTDGSLATTATRKQGYYCFFANGTTSGNAAAVLRRENIANGILTVEGAGPSTLLNNVSAAASIGTTTRSVVFSITNMGGGKSLVTSTLFSGPGSSGTPLYSLSARDVAGLTAFDSFFLLTPTGTTVTYDNIKLTLTTEIPQASDIPQGSTDAGQAAEPAPAGASSR